MRIEKLKGYENIYQAEHFPDEVNALFGKNSGEKKRYLQWLATVLVLLDKEGIASLRLEQFELLKGNATPKLGAIRHARSKINDRYLFLFADDRRSILLTAFKEKDKRDYERAIARAQSILSSLDFTRWNHEEDNA